MDAATLLIAAVVGVAIGVLAGLLGIGGGTVMVPVFKLGFGMTAIGATATSLFAIIPTAISGAVTHVRQKTCIPKLGVLAGVGGACLSPVGVWLATLSPGWAIMLAAALVIGYSALTMLKKALEMPRSGGVNAAGGAGAAGSGSSDDAGADAGAGPGGAETAVRKYPAPSNARRRTAAPRGVKTAGNPDNEVNHWLGLPIGACAGLVAGYVGVGGGFLMVPLFLSVIGIDMKRASGTSLIAISILSTPGAITQIVLGNVAVGIALAVVAGSIPGATLGAHLAKRVPERQLRFGFAIMLLCAAVMLVVQELGLL